MPRRPSLAQRLTTAATWPAGMVITSWAYLWRTIPLHRRELEGSVERDGPPPVPAGVSLDEVQGPDDGAGSLLHRRYRVRIHDADLDAAAVIARIRDDLNCVAPVSLARFQKVTGDEQGPLEVGDEYVVRMPGPWDGPVRVIEASPTGFRFATLDGHLEAGQIAWRARDDDGVVVFEVESWSRPGDRFSAVMHHRLHMAKEVQLHMWTSVCEQVAGLARGWIIGGVDIETHIAPVDA